MRMNYIEIVDFKLPDRRSVEKQIQRKFGYRWADADIVYQRRLAATNYRQIGKLDVVPERVGNERNAMPGGYQRADSMQHTKWCPPRTEERLGSNH